MPMYSDAGAGNYAGVINAAGDRIRDQLGQNIAQSQQRADQNRLLHPSVNTWLQKVMAGEMTPAEAAAAAHAEIDGASGGSMPSAAQRLGEPGEQGMGGAAQVRTVPVGRSEMGGYNLPMMAGEPPPTPMPHMSEPPGLTRGGMGGAAAPMTQRDLMDAQRVGSIAAPFQRIAGQNERSAADRASRETIADLNNTGKNERADKKEKFEEKKLKEKSRQFDAYLKFKYDALQDQMDRLSMEINARRRLAQDARMEKRNDDLLKKDIQTISDIERQIVDLQNAKVRTGDLLEPEQAEQSDRMIRDLQRELGHLKSSVQFEMQQRGQRGSLRGEPGSQENEPKQGPELPGVGAPLNGQSVGTGRVEAPVKRGAAPPIKTDVDVREPKMIKVRNKQTGAEGYLDAAEVESFLGDVGEAEFVKRYEITGVK